MQLTCICARSHSLHFVQLSLPGTGNEAGKKLPIKLSLSINPPATSLASNQHTPQTRNALTGQYSPDNRFYFNNWLLKYFNNVHVLVSSLHALVQIAHVKLHVEQNIFVGRKQFNYSNKYVFVMLLNTTVFVSRQGF